MTGDDIGPESARAALATVAGHQAAVRKADLDRWALLVLATAQVAYMSVLAFGRPSFPVISLAWFGVIGVSVGFGAWRDRHLRVVSHKGRPVYWAALATYAVWFTFLWWVVGPHIGIRSGPDARFVVLAAVAVIPLLAGASIIGRGR